MLKYTNGDYEKVLWGAIFKNCGLRNLKMKSEKPSVLVNSNSILTFCGIGLDRFKNEKVKNKNKKIS